MGQMGPEPAPGLPSNNRTENVSPDAAGADAGPLSR
jgi:hypothetical protein